MRLKVIADHALTREVGYLAASSQNMLDLTFVHCGKHGWSTGLLQEEIDQAEHVGNGTYDAIVLALGADYAYGAVSHRVPLVVPRVHSAAALLLGSAQRERDIYNTSGSAGLTWYIPGTLEYREPDDVLPDTLLLYAQAVEAQNARCLLLMERDWALQRGAAAYVELPGMPYPDFKARCKACATYLEWPLTMHEGDCALLRALLGGVWDDDRFLTMPPQAMCEASYHSTVITLS